MKHPWAAALLAWTLWYQYVGVRFLEGKPDLGWMGLKTEVFRHYDTIDDCTKHSQRATEVKWNTDGTILHVHAFLCLPAGQKPPDPTRPEEKR